MSMSGPNIALYYDDGAYVEMQTPTQAVRSQMAVGLMGRQVAGKQFLDAYLSHASWDELVAVVPNQASGRSLLHTCQTHPSSRKRERRLRLIETKDFTSRFVPHPPAPLLYLPCPPDGRFAWAREHAQTDGFALCGVTHTLCSAAGIEALRNLITAPFEPYDRLICTSRAVIEMVREVTDTYADYLRQRHGGQPGLRIGLEHIPLGVDTDKFRPATLAERSAHRARLQITDDEVAVLFVGRLSHHAKAHPFPMFRGLSAAAKKTGAPLHLLLSGWAASPAVLDAFRDGARQFADKVRVSWIDGTDPDNRFAVWKAADIFTSLSDNIQETFGLVIVEAMASGLPVVATDWNGYRDLIVSGEHGFLIPTFMVRGATHDLTTQLLLGEVDYDHFLARCNQCVAVDSAATADAFARLIADPQLRQRMGKAARRRVCQHFAWPRVIQAYQHLWNQQQAERAEYHASRDRLAPTIPHAAAYPPPEHSFSGYPTQWLHSEHRVQAAPEAASRLELLLSTPLTNYESACRCSDSPLLQEILRSAATPRKISELDRRLRAAGMTRTAARASLAWMLKYDLLRTTASMAGPAAAGD